MPCRRNYANAASPRHIGRKDFSTTCCAIRNRLGRNGNMSGKIRCAPGLWSIPANGDISAKYLLWTVAWNVCDVRVGVFVAALCELWILFGGRRPPLQGRRILGSVDIAMEKWIGD